MSHRFLLPSVPRAEVDRAKAEGLVVALRRRGVHHGWVVVDEEAPALPGDAVEERWQGAWPVPIGGAFVGYLEPASHLEWGSLELFDRLRRGRRFLPELRTRLEEEGEDELEITSSTVDLLDLREIEKVYCDAKDGDGAIAVKDVWAKLSWIADDDTDVSLRIRFSCGAECLDEWVGDAVGARWADRLAETVFPECAVLTEHTDLRAALDALVGQPVRCSERIVYSNAPNGGAVFHHDADPGQLGVLYGQLSGWTAWLALPKQVLAEELAAHAVARGGALAEHCGSQQTALAALPCATRAGEVAPEVWNALNADPALTARLVERGAFQLVRAGDALVLPSHGPDDVAWHSVFSLGRRPSLAHSYGLFPA